MLEELFKTFVAGELPAVGSDGYSGHEEQDETGKWNHGPRRDWTMWDYFQIDEASLKHLDPSWRSKPRIVRLQVKDRRKLKGEGKWEKPACPPQALARDRCRHKSIRWR
jgi:hypothetical protein